MTQIREQLIACLRKVESSGNPLNIGSTTNWHRNPEGPQAANLIESLLSDLEAMQQENGRLRAQLVGPANVAFDRFLGSRQALSTEPEVSTGEPS